jgi:hypothetical protein
MAATDPIEAVLLRDAELGDETVRERAREFVNVTAPALGFPYEAAHRERLYHQIDVHLAAAETRDRDHIARGAAEGERKAREELAQAREKAKAAREKARAAP